LKLGDIISHIFIDRQKLLGYALNPEHSRGRHKAVVFKQLLGYTEENYELLLRQIEAHALESEVQVGIQNEHGQRYTVDIEVIGTEGQIHIVRTGWIVPPDSNEARLITLYVR
jgi:hypothetical protein